MPDVPSCLTILAAAVAVASAPGFDQTESGAEVPPPPRIAPAIRVFVETDAPMTGPGPDGGVRALEVEVLAEMNRLRTDPRAYVEVLQAYRDRFEGAVVSRPGRISIRTREGVRAVDEAIDHLKTRRPVPALAADPTLTLSARDHARDQGPTGQIGHIGPDGDDLATRLSRHGGRPYGGENISYGYDTAREIVVQLLVDDGVPGRGHRTNLFGAGFASAGVGCGPHARFYYMCVIDYGFAPSLGGDVRASEPSADRGPPAPRAD